MKKSNEDYDYSSACAVNLFRQLHSYKLLLIWRIHDYLGFDSRLFSSVFFIAATRGSGDVSSTEADRKTSFIVNICSSGLFDYFWTG
jgi:hypothetical protein